MKTIEEAVKIAVITILLLLFVLAFSFTYMSDGSGEKDGVFEIKNSNLFRANSKHYYSYDSISDSGDEITFTIKKTKALFGLSKGKKYKITYITSSSGKNIIKSYSVIE